MNGKGSKQRPSFVSKTEFDKKYDKIFGPRCCGEKMAKFTAGELEKEGLSTFARFSKEPITSEFSVCLKCGEIAEIEIEDE